MGMSVVYVASYYKQGKDMKYNYIVWVGGVDDYFVYYKDAQRAYDDWIDEGYDDVIMEIL